MEDIKKLRDFYERHLVTSHGREVCISTLSSSYTPHLPTLLGSYYKIFLRREEVGVRYL